MENTRNICRFIYLFFFVKSLFLVSDFLVNERLICVYSTNNQLFMLESKLDNLMTNAWFGRSTEHLFLMSTFYSLIKRATPNKSKIHWNQMQEMATYWKPHGILCYIKTNFLSKHPSVQVLFFHCSMTTFQIFSNLFFWQWVFLLIFYFTISWLHCLCQRCFYKSCNVYTKKNQHSFAKQCNCNWDWL